MSNPTLGFDLGALESKGKFKTKFKFAGVEQGQNFYRILSPISKTNRELSHTWNSHWLQNPDKKVQVLCTYYTQGTCPICIEHKSIEAQLKAANDSNNDELVEELEKHEAALRKSKNVYYTAVNANNEIVALRLSSTVSTALDKLIAKAVREDGYDPTAPDTGVWFNFTRDGKGRDAVSVSIKTVTVEVNGRKLKDDDRTPISDETLSKIATDAPDIHNSNALWIKSYDARVLADFLRGVPLPVEKFNKSNSTDTENSVNTSKTTAQTETPTPTPTAQTKTEVPTQTTNSTSGIQSEIERIRAKRATTTK